MVTLLKSHRFFGSPVHVMTDPQPTPAPPKPRSGAHPATPGQPSLPPVGDRFFRQLVGSMRNGVLAIARDGRVVAMNEVAYRVFNIDPTPDDIGAPYTDVLQDQPDVGRILGAAFELQNLPNRAELKLRTSGKVIGYTLSHVLDDAGDVVGAALFFKDLTLVEQLEERERLRDRLAALGEMAAAIAHEVKNPLAGIEVMAGLLRRRIPDSPEAQGLINDIIAEAKVANAIVLEVLDFVRPIRLQVERTSIPQVLHDAVTTAERKVSRGGVNVTLNVQEQLPLIEADHHQLVQVFSNLIINALEALNGTGTIAIAAVQGEGYVEPGAEPRRPGPPTVVVDVADSGPGVSPEILDRVFNPFFTTKPQGSGLGLAIVRKIVDAHNGHIDFTSAAGQGTRFRVTLPMEAGEGWLR